MNVITLIQRGSFSEDDIMQNEPIVIGAVAGEHTEETIAELFELWQDPLLEAGTPPECDSDFIAWLVQEKGFTEAPVPNIVTV